MSGITPRFGSAHLYADTNTGKPGIRIKLIQDGKATFNWGKEDKHCPMANVATEILPWLKAAPTADVRTYLQLLVQSIWPQHVPLESFPPDSPNERNKLTALLDRAFGDEVIRETGQTQDSKSSLDITLWEIPHEGRSNIFSQVKNHYGQDIYVRDSLIFTDWVAYWRNFHPSVLPPTQP